MSTILITGVNEYQYRQGAFLLAEDVMCERAYAQACYQDANKIFQWGLSYASGRNCSSSARSVYDVLIKSYERHNGVKNTIAFSVGGHSA
jgi:hypothetical protein